MPGSMVPAIVGVVLLFLVGALALLAEWRSTEARWFSLLNFCLAATTALGTASTAVSYGHAARALAFGKAANGAGSLAFAALYLQLSAIGRATTHASIQRLRRFTGAAVAVSLVAGVVVVVAWTVSMVVAIYRHGSARQRREVAWIAVGVLLFDLAGMVMLA